MLLTNSGSGITCIDRENHIPSFCICEICAIGGQIRRLHSGSTQMRHGKPRIASMARRDDDRVLAAALAGHADAIVTGDKDLPMLRNYLGIRILSPRQFLELLDRRP